MCAANAITVLSCCSKDRRRRPVLSARRPSLINSSPPLESVLRPAGLPLPVLVRVAVVAILADPAPARSTDGRLLKKSASFVLAGHCRLTISAAFTNVLRLIRRGVNLRGSTYHRARAARAARGGGEKGYALPLRHWALTISRPSANVRLLIRRLADLAAALPEERRVLARRGWAGENDSLFEQPAATVKFSGTSDFLLSQHAK